ncbi:MAG: hypothetical protein WA418_14385 [Bradyrhizobium sp.]
MWRKLRAKLTGWRTILWNAFIALVPVILASLDQLKTIDLAAYLTPLNAVIAGFFISAVGVWLRLLTTGPIGGSAADIAPGGDAPATER